jgi:hypothetical protein
MNSELIIRQLYLYFAFIMFVGKFYVVTIKDFLYKLRNELIYFLTMTNCTKYWCMTWNIDHFTCYTAMWNCCLNDEFVIKYKNISFIIVVRKLSVLWRFGDNFRNCSKKIRTRQTAYVNKDIPTWCHLFYYFTNYCSTCFEC